MACAFIFESAERGVRQVLHALKGCLEYNKKNSFYFILIIVNFFYDSLTQSFSVLETSFSFI